MSHHQTPKTPVSFPTLGPAVSEHSDILISNTPIMHDDIVPRVDLGILTISDGALNPLGVSIQPESHCVCRMM